MKRNFMQGFIMSVALFFAVGCQKESKSLPEETSVESSASKPESAGSCRLTSYDYYDGLGDFHDIDNFTYKNGLLDDVNTGYGWRLNMEYDKQGKLIASRVYEGETLLYTITFVYEKNRVVQEIWRDAITGEVADELFLTYDQKGNLVRNESFVFDFYVIHTYTNDGRLESWKYFSAGLPAILGEYTYEQNIKNPFRSLKGVDYTFWYANAGFGIGTGERWYSSEKISFYDENGNPEVYYEQDATQTVGQLGKQHYPIQVDYVDLNTDLPIINTFTYENCEPGQSSNTARFNKTFSSKNSKGTNRIKPPLKLLQKMQ